MSKIISIGESDFKSYIAMSLANSVCFSFPSAQDVTNDNLKEPQKREEFLPTEPDNRLENQEKVCKILVAGTGELMHFGSISTWQHMELFFLQDRSNQAQILASSSFWNSCAGNLKGSYPLFERWSHRIAFYEAPDHYCPIKKTLIISPSAILHRPEKSHSMFSVLTRDEPEYPFLNHYFDSFCNESVRTYPLHTLGL